MANEARRIDTKPPLRERFPALGRVEIPDGKIPFVAQLATTDCGAAALAMTLGFHGKHVTLEEVRRVVGLGRDGTTAATILDAASTFGLVGRAVSIDMDALSFLTRGSILHWQFRHWVVFDGPASDGFKIVDPAGGPRIVTEKEFRRSFTGVALLFEPGTTFEPHAMTARRGSNRYFDRILGHRGLLVRIVVTSFVLRALALALPALTGLVVDRVIPRSDYSLLLVVMLGLGFVVGFTLIASLLRSQLNLQLRSQVDAEMTLEFVDHLVGLPYEYFQLRTPGDLMVRLGSNAKVREILTSGVLSTVLDGTLALVYVAILIAVSPMLGATVLVLGAVRVVVLVFVRRKQRDLQTRALEVQSRSTSYQIEMLGGMEMLKSLGTEQRAAEHYANLYVENLNVDLEQGRLTAKLDALTSALDALSPMVVLSVGVMSVLGGRLSLGTMLALSALATAFFAPLVSLVSTLSGLQLLASYLARIDEVFDTSREQAGIETVQAPRLTGAIRLENVSFRYGQTGPFVVKDVSVQIRAGERIAIVGESGSGKTTLGRLLVALYRPTEGKVLFDDRDLETLDYRSVRRQLGVVTQRPTLFSGTIRRTIAHGRDDVSMDEIVAAAQLAAIHEDIEAMPLGYETLVTADGSSLSGGQRQRLTLARALLRRPALLLLDEATSSLDAITEGRVQAGLTRLRCTQIIIAHRLSTVQDADRILVMHEGAIVEAGTHGELVATGGRYAALVATQLGGFDPPRLPLSS
jgi:ATP-binding cassette, subfamily B, bacterial